MGIKHGRVARHYFSPPFILKHGWCGEDSQVSTVGPLIRLAIHGIS